ncbi:MAG: hypothetical protein ACT4PV_09160 [Planctomycetaceae bacterium]
MKSTKNVKLTVAGGGARGAAGGRPGRRAMGGGRTARAKGDGAPRAGSLPARVIAWAGKRSRPFGTNDVSRKFKLSRAHASMILSRLATGPFPIKREKRGLYIGS